MLDIVELAPNNSVQLTLTAFTPVGEVGAGAHALASGGDDRTITLNNAELAITLNTPPAFGSEVAYTIVDAVHDCRTRHADQFAGTTHRTFDECLRHPNDCPS